MRFRAQTLRKTVLDMAHAGSSVHIACAFSLIEIVAVLYRSHLRVGSQPGAPERDYLVLSKGHGVMAQYACLRELGWLSDADIANYFQDGTLLRGLAESSVPGIEASTGSLGHGLSVAVGLALAARKSNTDQRVFAIVGDGEMNEGPIWEALLFANQFELGNLTVIVDVNRYQAMGTTDEVMKLGNLAEKFRDFGFISQEVDGHDETGIDATLKELQTGSSKKPKAMIAHTIKGKGISFMEGKNLWHYTRLTDRTYADAMAELEEKSPR